MSNKKLPIDGPAGRNEVTDDYRENYDSIFRKSITLFFGNVKDSETTGSTIYYNGVKVFETRPDGSIKRFPKKSQKGGGKNAG